MGSLRCLTFFFLPLFVHLSLYFLLFYDLLSLLQRLNSSFLLLSLASHNIFSFVCVSYTSSGHHKTNAKQPMRKNTRAIFFFFFRSLFPQKKKKKKKKKKS